jgi:hypothetical protein
MRRLAALGLIMLATIATALALTGPARAGTTQAGPASCAVNYTVITEGGGEFYAQISVIYQGYPAGIGWVFSFEFASPQQLIAAVWSDQWSQSGEAVAVTNQGQAITGNGSLQLSFIGVYGSVNPPPVNFTFDGVACSTGAILDGS